MKALNTRTLLGWGGAAAVLAVVFAAYLAPDLAFALATQLWNCF